LENTLRRIAYALRFDDNEYYKALAASFLLSADNAHAAHPNHPEKCDPTNRVRLGGGIVIKSHANGAYITDALSSAVFKTVLDKAGVPYQTFFNRSDMRSGRTLGAFVMTKMGMHGVDIGLPQLRVHCRQPRKYHMHQPQYHAPRMVLRKRRRYRRVHCHMQRRWHPVYLYLQ
jgi:aspartyl aminopeptidase